MENRRKQRNHMDSPEKSSLDPIDLKRQLEKLERDLNRRDRELEEEKLENERVMNRVKKLERDKHELKRELEDVHEEANEYRKNMEETQYLYEQQSLTFKNLSAGKVRLIDQDESDTSDRETRHGQENDLNIVILGKNREIGQLLEDIEKIEDEKRMLKDKLTDLKDSLQDATMQIETMARDHFEFKNLLQKSEDKVKKLTEEKTILEIKERDLLAFKERHDQYLENLCSAVDIRVDVWKKMMFQKDEEIERLNNKVEALMVQVPNTQIDTDKTTIQQLKKKLRDRDEQVSILNEKLIQATEELDSSTKALETLQSKFSFSENTEKMEKVLKSLENKLFKCQSQLEKKSIALVQCEKEAEYKSQENIELLSRLHGFESGEYGLSEAVTEIKDLKTQIRVRDRQVESVTQEINRLRMDQTDLQDENEMLRFKMKVNGMESLKDDTKSFIKSKKNELAEFRIKVEQLENDVVVLKTKNYTLRKQLIENENGKKNTGVTTTLPSPQIGKKTPFVTTILPLPSPQKSVVDKTIGDTYPKIHEEWRDKYEHILQENTELRKGLQEILESMRRLSEDGTADIMIESPILENLLREMSARGLINYPYPISSFHLKVCNLEGKNSQLREELHRIRQEEKQLQGELMDAKTQILILEEKLRLNFSKVAPRNRSRSRSTETDKSRKSPRKLISTTKDELIPQHQPEIIHKIPSPQVVEIEETTLHSIGEVSMGVSLSTRKNFVLEDLQGEIQSLKDENNNIKSRFIEEKASLESQMITLVQKGNELLDGDLNFDERNRRKIEFLRILREQQKNENNFLHKRMAQIENEYLSRISYLERFKAKALQQISTVQLVLESSIPLSVLFTTKKQLSELTRSYETLKDKHDRLSLDYMKSEKACLDLAELKRTVNKLKAELEYSQGKLESKTPLVKDPISENLELTQKLVFVTRENNLLIPQIDLMEKENKQHLIKINNLQEIIRGLEGREKELQMTISESISRDEYDLLVQKHLETNEYLTLAKDDILKWQELAELAQNQVMALENLKEFEKLDLESLVSQVCDLQANELNKSEVARIKRELVTCEKDKHITIQHVQKLLAKLSQIEGSQLQQEKIHTDRELALISMHTQIINRYRSLFAALHENSHMIFLGRNPNSAQQITEALELFTNCKIKCEELEEELAESKIKTDEYREKCLSLEDLVTSMKGGREIDYNFECAHKVQNAKLEVSRWKRKAEQAERTLASLRETLHRVESRAAELEEDRIRLEHSIEIKDSLTSTIMSGEKLHSNKNIPIQNLSTSSIPLMDAESLTSLSKLIQTEGLAEIYAAEIKTEKLEKHVSELEILLKAKDQVINNFRILHIEPAKVSEGVGPDLEDALQVARETMATLDGRLKAKEDNILQYRKLLADVRNEMSMASERHVQEMKVLQLTIHQQQQAFTRMKSTLSHPVKDNSNIESRIKDQMTRINELEDEVSELQHTMGNVASQLTAARSDAHRWRTTADNRLKELDKANEQINSMDMNEMNVLKEKVRQQQETIVELKKRTLNMTSVMSTQNESELVSVLRQELEEREKQLEIYAKTLKKSIPKLTEKSQSEDQILASKKEIDELSETNKQLQQKLSTLQVKLSKLNAANQKSGISAEMEELRTKFRASQDEKRILEKKLEEISLHGADEDEKKRITVDRLARWEESKKWKRSIDKLETRLKEVEIENEKLLKTVKSLRTSNSRLEREKLLLDSQLKGNKRSRTKDPLSNGPDESEIIEKLTTEIQQLRDSLDKTNFENKEEGEKLKMEVKILKERIILQERQLTAYQVAQKGDPKVVSEIEKMVATEDLLEKNILHLEEENLTLKLQIEQLRLDTPRLRDRVQHLQKLVDVLKSEKADKNMPNRSSSHKSLNELERTIVALKTIIEKLQHENKKLKKPGSSSKSPARGKLQSTLQGIISEKKLLMDQVHHLEQEKLKYHKLYIEASTASEEATSRLSDAEKRARSAEMKLRSFLDELDVEPNQMEKPVGHHDRMYLHMRTLQEELDRKNKLLGQAKEALREAASEGKK